MLDIETISIADIERDYSPGVDRHWFDADTLRFFKSRLASYGYRGPGGTFFVSSEKPPHGPRAYTVRQLVGPGKIKTVGEFCEIKTRATADRRAKALAKWVDEREPAGTKEKQV